jgi:hypothetical protein
VPLLRIHRRVRPQPHKSPPHFENQVAIALLAQLLVSSPTEDVQQAAAGALHLSLPQR